MVYGFWHSDEVLRSNDLQFIFTPASYKLGVHGLLDDHPGFTAAWKRSLKAVGTYARRVPTRLHRLSFTRTTWTPKATAPQPSPP